MEGGAGPPGDVIEDGIAIQPPLISAAGGAPLQQPQLMEMLMQQQQIIQQLLAAQQSSVSLRQTDNGSSLNKVKLPPFWEKDTAAWFRLVEEILEAHHVTDLRARYRLTLLSVPQHILERARGVLNAADTAADPYSELKSRLIELLTPSELDQVNSIIWGAELGGRRPSEMMDGMLAALPQGEPAGLLFKGQAEQATH